MNFFEGKNGQKFKRDENQKKVYLKTANGEEEIPSTNAVFKDARAYGTEITEEEYLTP